MTVERKFAILFAGGEDPSRRYRVCWIDLPTRLIEPLLENRYATGIAIVRRLANGSIPPYTVHREDRANGRA